MNFILMEKLRTKFLRKFFWYFQGADFYTGFMLN